MILELGFKGLVVRWLEGGESPRIPMMNGHLIGHEATSTTQELRTSILSLSGAGAQFLLQ